MRRAVLAAAAPAVALLAACRGAPRPAATMAAATAGEAPRLPTGQRLDPVGVVSTVGQMPLAMASSPGGRRVVLLLDGYREEGIQVVDRQGRVTQTLSQPAAFIGLAFSPDGQALYASGGNQDVVYRYRWDGDSASLRDSLVLAVKAPRAGGTRYPAGLAVSAGGHHLYVAENLADSLAVVDVASGAVVQRLPTGRYPYGVVVGPDGTVYVSNWGANTVSVFPLNQEGRLERGRQVPAGRHPSALIMNRAGSRLFVASGSTDRISVIDPASGHALAELRDPPPGGVSEGATPNALALSDDGTRLFAAEADANAVAVFDLSSAAAGTPARGTNQLLGRIPVGWFPTSLAVLGDTLVVANGKGARAGPNPRGPVPGMARPMQGPAREAASRQYTLGQIEGSLVIAPLARVAGADLAALTARVSRANGWDQPAAGRGRYPPFTHVIYVIRENRTYDQVLGDLAGADGDTALVYFGRDVTPNAHALAQRFGIFDRFFVNAEVSADGHNWSDAAYVTDYIQKTAPINYSGRGRSFDFQGMNRDSLPEDDVAEPARGYLWDAARRAGVTVRDYGEFVSSDDELPDRIRSSATKAFLRANQARDFAGWNLAIRDTTRMNAWLREFRQFVANGRLPKLSIMALPNDHTAGAAAGSPTPKAMVADNDLALGRMIEALSHSPYWRNTVVFVLEDDAQNGPDHVDSHRSPLLVISAYTRGGLIHRFANTTDVLCTIEEILGLERLSQFDAWGRPLRDIWNDTPDTASYTALAPRQSLDEMNPARTRTSMLSRRLDLAHVDAADMELFNRVLWESIKGERAPYPGARRMSLQESVRDR